MPLRKKNKATKAIALGHARLSLVDDALNTLAERLDPPVRKADSVIWEQPPDIVDWAHSNFIDPTTNTLVVLADHQQRILRIILKLVWEHKVDTVVWSEIKKSGKTTIAGLIGAYWATFVEAPNEVITIANDQEQAQGRIYAAMVATLRRLGWNVPDQKPTMDNYVSGSKVKAIGTNYAGEAGGNYGLTLWSELWAYKSESRKRLWDELTHVPTRRYSIRWIETYAGFKNESELLWDVYCKTFQDGDETKPLGAKVEGLEDLPCWYLGSSKTFVYWSHDPRMPWQTPEFLESQRNAPGMRPSTFRRLWQNYWVDIAEAFITPEQWDALNEAEALDEDGDERSLFLGADASVTNDHTGLVAATWKIIKSNSVTDEKERVTTNTGYPSIVGAWEWLPLPSQDKDERAIVDLSATIKVKIKFLLDNFNVVAIFYDEYQLHSIMTDLKKEYDPLGTKKLFVSFPQSSGRVESDQAFYQWIITKTLTTIKDVKLRSHVLNAVARQTDRGFRLDKEATKNKIDLAVAASMACYAASTRNRPPRKFLKI